MDQKFENAEWNQNEFAFDMPEPDAGTQTDDISAWADATERRLSPEELAKVNAFAAKIDISSPQAIISYGTGVQSKMVSFSQEALADTRTKDMGEISGMITGLVTELKNFDVDDEKSGISGFFRKKKNNFDRFTARYRSVEANVDKIADELKKRQVGLMKDSALLEKLYQLNQNYYKELSLYILAGKKKLDEAKSVELPQLQQKAETTRDPQDVQAAKDLAERIVRFEKKLYDLQLTRTISLQTAPQIRLIQSSDNVMAEKIQSTIVNTIPLWKNQMVIALGIEHAQQAARAQREVTDMTNELLQKNAERLRTATVDTARESERGIVDMETLKHTNEELIATLDEVLKIQEEGRQKREAAETELGQIEDQLKTAVLDASRAEIE
ncbi:MAG: toxic anion resistance protein [Anaerovoracaceae bacterium]